MPDSCRHCQIICDRGTGDAAKCGNDIKLHRGYRGSTYGGYDGYCCNCANQGKLVSDQDYDKHGCQQCNTRAPEARRAAETAKRVAEERRAAVEERLEERRAAKALAAAEVYRLVHAA